MAITFETPLSMRAPVSPEMVKILQSLQRNPDRKPGAQEDAARLFAATFQLGTPRFDLPSTVVHTVHSFVRNDLSHWRRTHWVQQGHRVAMPRDDHLLDFYTIVPLGNGFDAAIATARVSQPYKTGEDHHYKTLQAAKDNGLYAFEHNDWSWHYPGKTDLLVYTKRVPVRKQVEEFNNSMLKWLIVNRQYVEQLAVPFTGNKEIQDFNAVVRCIEDIVDDPAYPHTNLSRKSLEKIGYFDNLPQDVAAVLRYLHSLFECEQEEPLSGTVLWRRLWSYSTPDRTPLPLDALAR